MTHTQMLAQLAQSYAIRLSHDGAHFRLALSLKSSDLAAGDCAGCYLDASLERAVARAWAGERPDA